MPRFKDTFPHSTRHGTCNQSHYNSNGQSNAQGSKLDPGLAQGSPSFGGHGMIFAAGGTIYARRQGRVELVQPEKMT